MSTLFGIEYKNQHEEYFQTGVIAKTIQDALAQFIEETKGQNKKVTKVYVTESLIGEDKY